MKKQTSTQFISRFCYLFIPVILFVLFTLPIRVFALGQMSEPIVVDNAMRGEKIEKEMIIVNSDDFEVEVELAAEGDIAGWVNFYQIDNINQTINTAFVPSEGRLKLLAVINIPSDAQSKLYSGAISAINMPPDTEDDQKESRMYVRQKIDREVSITISDEGAEINLQQTSVIPHSYDFPVGEPLRIRIIYDNQGNVVVNPQLRLVITKKDKTISDLIYPYPNDEAPINSLSQREIEPITIQTIDWEKGKYLAELTFIQNGESVAEKQFTFNLQDKKSIFGGWFGMSVLSPFLGYIFVILFFVALYFVVLFFRKNPHLGKE